MYLEFYGLKEPPFSITPDPRYVFLSERHRDALAHLLYGVGKGGSGGFVQLTGEVGTGKTTLCRLVLEQLPENTRVALVLNPRTPRSVAASQLRFLSRRDLVSIHENPATSTYLRRCIERIAIPSRQIEGLSAEDRGAQE